MLDHIGVQLFGEGNEEAITLPPYLKEAYSFAEKFTAALGKRMRGTGFLKTLLLRRVGSTIYAGRRTAEKMLADWQELDDEWELDDETSETARSFSRTLTASERGYLEHLLDALEANQKRAPKYEQVRHYLFDKRWQDKEGKT